MTVLEFPLWFAHVVASDSLGIALLVLRNGLLVVATVVAARVLWCTTVSRRRAVPAVVGAGRAAGTTVSS